MSVFENYIETALKDFEWIRTLEDQDFCFSFFEQLLGRLLTDQSMKIATVSKKADYDVQTVQKTLLSIAHICINIIQEGTRARVRFNDLLRSWAKEEAFYNKISAFIDLVLDKPDCETLLRLLVNSYGKGNYKSSALRLDVEAGQRALHVGKPNVSFVLRLETEDDQANSFRFSPEMLEKFSTSLETTIHLMQNYRHVRNL